MTVSLLRAVPINDSSADPEDREDFGDHQQGIPVGMSRPRFQAPEVATLHAENTALVEALNALPWFAPDTAKEQQRERGRAATRRASIGDSVDDSVGDWVADEALPWRWRCPRRKQNGALRMAPIPTSDAMPSHANPRSGSA